MVYLTSEKLFIFEISHDFSGHQIVFPRSILFRLIINWILAHNKGDGRFIKRQKNSNNNKSMDI